MIVEFSLNRESLTKDGHNVVESFEALVANLEGLLTLHASDEEAVAHLHKAKALAQRGAQLARNLSC